MEIGMLYNFVLVLVLTFMLVGVGVLALNKFSETGLSESAGTALNNSRTAVGSIATTWGTLIVTIGVLAVVITLVVRGFSGAGR